MEVFYEQGETFYIFAVCITAYGQYAVSRDCESSENIEIYFKLPFWFKINTPIGTYNPDWAIVFNGEKKIYFVAETKGEGQELRLSEEMKIACGKAHFEQFDDVTFKGPVSSVSKLTG